MTKDKELILMSVKLTTRQHGDVIIVGTSESKYIFKFLIVEKP